MLPSEYIVAGAMAAIITALVCLATYFTDDITNDSYPMDTSFTKHVKRYWPLLIIVFLLSFILIVGASTTEDPL